MDRSTCAICGRKRNRDLMTQYKWSYMPTPTKTSNYFLWVCTKPIYRYRRVANSCKSILEMNKNATIIAEDNVRPERTKRSKDLNKFVERISNNNKTII